MSSGSARASCRRAPCQALKSKNSAQTRDVWRVLGPVGVRLQAPASVCAFKVLGEHMLLFPGVEPRNREVLADLTQQVKARC